MKLHRNTSGFTFVELTIVVAIIGILAAIAIPNFIKFQARSKQSEAKANMRALYTAEKAYFQEKDTFTTKVATIEFTPTRGYRFTVTFTPTTLQIVADPEVLGISGTESCVISVVKVPGAPWPPDIPPEPVCTPIPGADDAQQMMFLKITALGAAAVAGAILEYADGPPPSGGTGPVTADALRTALAQPGLMIDAFAAMDANHDGTVTMAEAFSYGRNRPQGPTHDWVADFLAASRSQISIIATDADLASVGFTRADLPSVLCTTTPGPLAPPCTIFPEVQPPSVPFEIFPHE